MIILDKENIKPFDVDDCLVMHKRPDEQLAIYDRAIEIEDPYSGEYITLYKNNAMIRLLKEEKARNGTVIVWSRGGHQWALAVVTALQLECYVDLIMSKPMVYFDDRDVSEWLRDRVYIGPDTRYKV